MSKINYLINEIAIGNPHNCLLSCQAKLYELIPHEAELRGYGGSKINYLINENEIALANPHNCLLSCQAKLYELIPHEAEHRGYGACRTKKSFY